MALLKLGVLGILILLNLLLCGFRVELNKSEWASWVQSIGSIAAILAAAWVGLHQSREARRLEKDRQRDQDLRRFEAVKELVARTFEITDMLLNAWTSPENPDSVNKVEKFDTGDLKDCKQSLERLPVFEVPEARLVVYVARLPRAISDLIHWWQEARNESTEPMNNYPYASEEEVEPALRRLHRLCTEAGAICAREIARLSRPNG